MPEQDIEDVRAAYPEWEIGTDSAGDWHARLTTSQVQPQPHLVAGSLAKLADALNDYVAGSGRLRSRQALAIGA